MKFSFAITALVAAVASLAQADSALETCTTQVVEVLMASISNDDSKACYKDIGLTTTTLTEADIKKALNSAVCAKGWDNTVKTINAIKPSCDFANLDGSGTIVNTAKFALKYNDSFAYFTKMAEKLNGTATTASPKDSSSATTTAPTTTKPSSSMTVFVSAASVAIAAVMLC